MSMNKRPLRSRHRAGGIAVLAVMAAPVLASAQTAPAAPALQEGSLVVETMESGFVVTPDFRFTEVDDKYGSLAGIRAGWLTDDRLLIGGAGYWLANGSADRKMAYGGLVVEWSLARSRRFGLSFGALVGGGSSTLGVDVLGFPRGRFPHHRWPDTDPGEPETVRVGAREGFFIAEPQANVSLLLTRWLRLGAGVGYRLLGGAGQFESRLRGVSGTVSVQMGTF
jgi:hypothetical protein